MPKFYTALNVQQYAELLQSKQIPYTHFEEKYSGFLFSEDKAYWIEKLKAQEDLDEVADYQYSILIEIELPAAFINNLIESDETGRFSQKVVNMYKTLGKELTIKPLQHSETNILCLMDVYETEETEDGIAQSWMLKCDSEEGALWQRFAAAVYRVACVGAIPGAVEAAKELHP